jgi:glutathione synthase/RimK-type ligase-like ATP-grasp enzyme
MATPQTEETTQETSQATTQETSQATTQETTEKKEPRLVDVAIINENTALNVMVGFLSLANKRGCFSIDESAKIWECILKFKVNQ